MTRNESRRSFLRRTAALAVAGGAPALALRPALAEGAYPSRPIKVLIGTPPGDSLDGYMRLLAEGMGRHLGQAIVVDNKPGAHGMIVGGAAKAATPDGYTVLASSGGPMSINPGLYKERLNYDPLKDFAPIAPVLRGPIFLYCNNDVPVHNLKEMVAWVKQQGNKVSYGSGGTGTTQHLTMELLKRATGMQMTHVPYRGQAPTTNAVITGEVALLITSMSSTMRGFIDNGKLKAKIVDGRMVLELQTDILFGSGSADLSAEGAATIREVGGLLAQIPERKFQVEGHTDNVPIKSKKYPSNWELASARAINVVKEMVDAGMPGKRVSAASYADSRPTATNETEEGRAQNRRIEIVIVPDLSDLPGAEQIEKMFNS